MKTVILAAGFGTRLYPLTLNKSKVLLEIKGKPLVDYTIEKIPRKEGIVIVTNGKFYNDFQEWAKNHPKIKIVNDNVFENENRLGGIGDLWLAIEKEKIYDDLLIVLGDNFFGFEISDFVETFKKNQEIMMGVYETSIEQAKKFGVVEIDDDMNLKGVEEKPENPRSNLIIAGLYALPKENIKDIREYVRSGKNNEGVTYLIKDLMKREKIKVHQFRGEWHDIGSLEDYKKLKNG
ncbi:hypothetical protein COU59_01590 [Candidatus Pacearchaeota archaeon CG10_big_fil_rev_8_21_14_0_10_34_12]|nr:MAG: hypothetical protein COU59_01590 [Candidatus Pacearchaeota archaeon CG10_big_fil_rev_8_21_14_0_10_34_12]